MLHNWQMSPKFPREKHPMFALKMVADRAEAVFNEQVGALRVTAPQCRLLMYLDGRCGEPVSQRELEHHLGVSHSTVKGLLQRLEEKGYVRTAFDSRDKRVKHAYLTDEFRRMKAGAQDALRSFESQLVAGFSAAELEQLQSMLERIYHNTLTPEPLVPHTENQ